MIALLKRCCPEDSEMMCVVALVERYCTEIARYSAWLHCAKMPHRGQ